MFALASGLAQADDRWSALWRNADQRGEQLLQKGYAAAAAKTFTDPRHKAYATLKAGEFADAAKAYSALDDGDAHYNRGNALAHSGDLKEALKAYDTALARDAQNRDAQHNRDLVEKALEQQEQQQQQQSGKQDQDSKGDDDQKQQGESGGNADPQKSDQSNPQDPSQEAGEKSQPEQQAGESKPKEDDAEAARRDAQASVEEAGRDRPTKPERGDANRAGEKPATATDSAAAKPLTEQQLAQEQWLRRIPDDPGGLLRRKFLIEHMLREQQRKQPP
ncbi:MAG: tetratricopeptide repeat protein [Panacagrimonas sp.]